MNAETRERERLAHELRSFEMPAASFEDQMLFAWAKVRQITGIPDASLTERDREMFMLGFAFDRAQNRQKHDDSYYPDVPRVTVPPSPNGEGLPQRSGIYFLWDGNKVDYVGRSQDINARVTLQRHHVLRPHHRISYVVMNSAELSWAEAFYIGVLRPMKNFGKHATHRRRMLLEAE